MFTPEEHQITQTVGKAISDMCELYEISKYELYEMLSEFFSIKAKELKPKPKPWESKKALTEYMNNL